MKKYFLIVPILVFLLATNLWADIISGTEYVGNGLFATDPWDPDATLTWSVIDPYDPSNTTGSYVYNYTFNTGAGDSNQISHLIIQVSDGENGFGTFQFEDMLIGTYLLETDPDPYPLLDDYSTGGANPGLPEDIYGIKWEEPNPENSSEWTITIVTNRAPMDGNFYAVDGKTPGSETYAFTGDEGGLGYNILVPDTLTQGKVPEPLTLILYGFGFAGAGLYRHLRRKRSVSGLHS